MGHVIAISSVKGGVAKTSTCSALGRSLSKMGYQVLLIDLDSHANLTLSVGVTQGNISYDSKNLFIPKLLDKLGINSFLAQTAYPNLEILPSKGNTDWNDRGLTDSTEQNGLLKKLFDTNLRLRYDFIVMDCAPSVNIYTLSALIAADLVIVPTQAEYFSANALVKMMKIIRHVRETGNEKLAYRVLVTMYSARTRLQRNVIEEFRKGFGENLFNTYIETDTKIRESQSAHIPLLDYKPSSRGAIQYQNLTNEVLDFFKQSANQPQRAVPPVELAMAQSDDTLQPYCPYLGFKNDVTTVVKDPSDLNYCHRARKFTVPKLEYQKVNCLTQSYLACPVLVSRKKIFMPAELQEQPPSLWDKLKFLTE